MSRLQAVIFDLDNTLIDRRAAFRTYAGKLLDEFVAVADDAERRELIDYIQTADQNGYRKKRELYEELHANLKLRTEEITVQQLLDYWFAEFFKCSTVMDGAPEVLGRLKANGLKLGLITNGSVHSQHAKIDQVGIRHYFDAIVVSDEVGLKKPDGGIFELTLARLNVHADRALYVGDHPVNDVYGAMNAGLQAVWFSGFMDWEPTLAPPKRSVSRLSELIPLLEGAF